MARISGISKTLVIYILLAVVIVEGIALGYTWQSLQKPGAKEETALVVGIAGAVGRVLNPQYTQGPEDPVTNQIFEGLFAYDPQTLALIPHLAEDNGTVSDDGLNYTFKLRQGVMFHDGTPFNATAVKAHFDLSVELGSRGVTYILTDVVNRTEIVDTYIIRYVLKFPNSDFRAILAHFATYIESPSATAKYGKDQLNDHPIGTGPFKFVSKILDSEVVLQANQDWWKLSDNEVIKIDTLIFKTIKDKVTAKLALENGEIDATIFESVHYADYPSLLANPDITAYDRTEVSSARWLSFCMNSSVWQYFPNKKMRQAFAYAIDYDKVISVGLGGQAERLYSFFPAEYEGYKAVYNYSYNPQKALALINESGFEAPVDVEVWTSPRWAVDPNMLAVIKDSALAAGFNVNIRQEEFGAYKERFIKTSTQEMCMWSWQADYASTDNWATAFMTSYGWGAKNSEIGAGDMVPLLPDLDNLVKEAGATTNKTRKMEILDQLQTLWNEWLPNLFLFRQKSYDFSRKKVQGIIYGLLNWDIKFQGATKT